MPSYFCTIPNSNGVKMILSGKFGNETFKTQSGPGRLTPEVQILYIRKLVSLLLSKNGMVI